MVARSFTFLALLFAGVSAHAEMVWVGAAADDGPIGYAGSILAPTASPAEKRFPGFMANNAHPADFWYTSLAAPFSPDIAPASAAQSDTAPTSSPHSASRLPVGSVGGATPYASGGLGCGGGAAAKTAQDGQRVAYKVGAGVLLPAPAGGNLDIGYHFCGTTDLRDIEAPSSTAGESHRLHIGYRMRF